MSTLKADLLEVIDMAVELTGSMMGEEREVRVAWLESVRKRVQAGNEYDLLRRKLTATRLALAETEET